MFLAPDELRTLTGRTRPSAQARWLKAQGIKMLVRPNGSLVVLRTAVEDSLGAVSKTARSRRKAEPDWSALNA
jgi:hypothetical protein